ncbi:Dynamin family protein [Caminicella sporogenes DSM 14501]|uniref:Dynamin family protein n=1 Tax=Caminicella sporogenes DSM 14501 TaxID=1121266 RepID=A0A1M6REH8_9FIRM|nr:patatin-like phospholipase family protein [Caminicella sporogenes]RKD25213.1 hypothetical protein BET04_03055 [Caminicella sporogenes]SHK30891.1 Dynamin family protein [Caminicella sporogenes DSM 14501]
MKKIGLVFSGGGGKGAYEIGVWKALNEFNIKPIAISGTSVGALNASLYVQGDLKKAIDVWNDIETKGILTINIEDIIKKFSRNKLAKYVDLSMIPTFIRTRGLFSQEGLKKVLDEVLECSKIQNSDITFFACTCNVKNRTEKYFEVNKYDDERIKKILLASSAIPGVFDEINIDGEIYFDGGLVDNTPIQPVYEMNCDTIIVVHLNRKTVIDKGRFPNTNIISIVPRRDLGGFIKGTLDFSNEGCKIRMKQGYEDACLILSKFRELLEIEEKYERILKKIKEREKGNEEIKNKITQTYNERIQIQQAIKKFNHMIVNDKLDDESSSFIPIPERNLLTEENYNLLNEIERKNIRLEIEKYLEKNIDNSSDIQNAALEAIGYLSCIDGQTNELKEQSLFKRILGNITGKNQEIVSSGQKNLAIAQYASYALLLNMHKKNLMTLELSAALNNKMNLIFNEISTMAEDINKQYIDVYRSMSLMFLKFRRKILENRDRIVELENRMEIQEWLSNIKVHTFNGVEYRNLSTIKKIVCIVNDFYHLTKSNWNNRDMKALQSALIDLNIEKDLITYGEFFDAISKDKSIIGRIFKGLYKEKNVQDTKTLLSSIEVIETDVANENMEQSLDIIYYKNSKDLDIPVFDLVLELLFNLKKSGYKVLSNKSLDGIKKNYIDKINKIKEIAKKNKFSEVELKEMDELKDKIEKFKIIVPVIGAFSSGKSTLLNTYMKRKILDDDLLPETCIATELHPSLRREEKAILHYLDNRELEIPISKLNSVLKNTDHLKYIEVHLDNEALEKHRDIVLVDMPGLDSNIDNHNKAIFNYVKEGVSFILCIETSQGLKDSVQEFICEFSLYGSDISVIMTKKELRSPDSIDNILLNNKRNIERLTGCEVFAGKVSSFQNDVKDFEKAIQMIEIKKDKLMKDKFYPLILEIAEKTKRKLKLLMNVENISIYDLERKKKELKRNIEELERILEKEKRIVMNKCQNEIPQYVVNDVRTVLEQNKSSLFERLRKNLPIQGKIEGFVQNTMRVSLNERARKVFEESAEKLSQYISKNIYSILDYDEKVSVSIDDTVTNINKLDTTSIIAIGAAGWILLGPIGGVIAAGIGLFMKKKKEQEMKNQLDDLILQVAENIREKAKETLYKSAEKFFEVLERKVNDIKIETNRNIERLENQIKKGKGEIEKEKAEIEKDIKELEAIEKK